MLPRRYRSRLLIGAFLAFTFVAGCRPGVTPPALTTQERPQPTATVAEATLAAAPAESGGSLRVHVPQPFDVLDPHRSISGVELSALALVYEGAYPHGAGSAA